MKAMNYYGGKELAASFRTVRGNTIKIAEEIPEDKYSFSPAPGVRTVAQTLAHIAFSTKFNEQVNRIERRTTMVGFDFPKFMSQIMPEADKPRTKAELLTLLRERGDDFAGWLESLTDDFLGESVSMPPGGSPPSRTRFDMLLSVKEHEMHHRGQLMIVERMLGITPHLTREMQARMAAMQQAAAQKS
jgi:uncharacterized damage-inducible protein DinB